MYFTNIHYCAYQDNLMTMLQQILLHFQAPIGTQLGVEVIPEVTGNIGGSIGKDSLVAKKRYQMHLKSLEGQIYVLLVNKDSDNEQPLVVQVSSSSPINYGIDFDPNIFKFLIYGNSDHGMIGFRFLLLKIWQRPYVKISKLKIAIQQN